MRQLACTFTVRVSYAFFPTCQDPTRTIYDGEWYINEYFTREVMMKSHHSYLFAQKLFTGRLGRF